LTRLRLRGEEVSKEDTGEKRHARRTASLNNTDAELGEKVRGSVRVIVVSEGAERESVRWTDDDQERRKRSPPSVESRSRILAETSLDQRTSSGVFVNEGRDVVDEARDDDKLPSLARLLDC
jgi:hypothetical protein